MSTAKIVVPEGMLNAARKAGLTSRDSSEADTKTYLKIAFKSALLWLDGEIGKMNSRLENAPESSKEGYRVGYESAKEDFRRMYDNFEPEVPEEIKDMLLNPENEMNVFDNNRLIEAFRRGQKAGKS